MDKKTLLESRNHGDPMFPLTIYNVDHLDGDVIFNWHWHPEIEFILMEEGTANFQIGTSNYTITAGEALFIPSGQLHAAFPIDQEFFRFYAIVFDQKLVSSFSYDSIQSNYIDSLNTDINEQQAVFLSNHTWQKNIVNSLKIIVHTADTREKAYELAIKAQLFNILFEIYNHLPQNTKQQSSHTTDTEKLNRLKQVLTFIEEHYQTKIQISTLYEQIQMSEGHFYRFFKSVVQMSPIEYINTLRINKAAKLLKDTDQKIIDISFEVGFDNTSYFIKTFKRQKKCTPSEFRRMI